MRKVLLKCVANTRSIRKISNQAVPCQDVSIPVPWGHVRGKWWGPTDVRPILTFHGWQDNCGSFTKLIPLLDNHAYLTIDLPGHGHSSWLPSGMFYSYMNNIMLCRYIKHYFGWSKVSLMGHSMGGIISYGYTMFYPEDVDLTVCLDGMKPLTRKKLPSYVSKSIDGFFKYNRYVDDPREPPSYTIEEIKQKICKPNDNSVKYEDSEHIMMRSIKPSKLHPGKYYFSIDPRLRILELNSFGQQELVEWAKDVTAPILMIKAKDAQYYEQKEHFYEVFGELKKASRDIEMHYVDGKHHVHLTSPEILAHYIRNFTKKHHKGNEEQSGFTDEIVVKDGEQVPKLRRYACGTIARF